MMAYLDASVLLRILLNQPNPCKDFARVELPVSSKLLRAECLRTLDRYRLSGQLTAEEHLETVSQLYSALDFVEFVEISDALLERTGTSFSVSLGTLDAIHLCSALKWQEVRGHALTFLTHDDVLAQAARLHGFTVLGSE